MTALDLGTADRVLTPPSSAFTSLTFGPGITLTPASSPHPVTTVGGWPAIPRGWTVGGADLNSSDVFTPGVNFATFIAVTGPSVGSVYDWDPVMASPAATLALNASSVTYAWAHYETIAAPGTLTAPHDSGVTVYAIVNNSTVALLANSRDGLIASVSPFSTAYEANTYFLATEHTDATLLGVWYFDGLDVSETDALDTITAIAAMLASPPAGGPVDASGAGGWGVTAASATVTVGDVDDDPAAPAQVPGGAQVPPSNPAPASPSAMSAAGVYPLLHVWETMPAPTLVDGIPVGWTATADGISEYAHVQIVVEGVDITLYDGIATPIPSWRRAEPFGAQSATIELPQITAFHVTPAWARHGANVAIRLVKLAGGIVDLFNGFVMDVGAREDSGTFTLEALGCLFSADLTLRPPSFSTAPQDIGTLIPSLLNAVPGRRYNVMTSVVTGIQTSVAGGWEDMLTGAVQGMLATALDSSAAQWTVACPVRTPALVKKDTTTIATTIRTGQRGIDIDLNSDASQAPNVIYGEGVAADGGRWRNAKYPNWRPDDTPPYPYDPPDTSIKVGTTDAMTDTGNGVSVWQRKVGQPVTGVFSQADRIVLLRIQRGGGITDDGLLGPQSWATSFDTGANTGTLDGAFIMPLAFAPEVMPRLYGPDGDDLGPNPAYDPDVIRVERKVNFGQGVDKATGTASAIRMLARDGDPGWFGVISFTMDPAEMSRYELREGMNIRILDWRGEDITVHVASARYDESVVTLEVDTNARDYPTLQALMTRDREAIDPAKTAVKRLLSGAVSTDRATFDAESPAGRIPKHAVYGGLWDVRRIPAGAFGTFVRSEVTTSSPASKFACAAFGKPVTAAQMVAEVGNPLTASENPWQSDALDDMGLLQAWGSPFQPEGYYPKQYSDPNGETSAPVTGRMVDDASWDYASERSPWIWVATFTEVSCNVEGRFYGAPTD